MLRGLSDIFSFFGNNETPIYFVSPTPFNVLSIDKWVNNFWFVNYFNSFDGHHPHVFVPTSSGPQEFKSMEEISNYLLGHKEVVDFTRGKGGKVVLVMFDEETEELAKDLGLDIALPPARLRKHLDSKIVTTRIGNEARVASVPNILGRADSYGALMDLAGKDGLGSDLVVQLPYGNSGRTTFFVESEADWDRYAEKIGDEELKVMRRINHMPGTLEACVTHCGTLVGPMMTDITGFEELTPYKGGWCGNDMFPSAISADHRDELLSMVRSLGDRLGKEGYRGVFCADFLIDTDSGTPYLGELNPRVSGATPPTHLITSTYGGVPMFLFHLLEFMDVVYDFDIDEVEARWRDFDSWSQLILKQTEEEVELITRAPVSGVYKLQSDGQIRLLRRELDWTGVLGDDEGFYMRVYGPGEYRYHGADLGIVVCRGRMQTDDRRLMDRAKRWAQAIKGEFLGVPPQAALEMVPSPWSVSKMF